MESSRGGPLSTFIMMLPLIVVPTVAMLKPAGNPVGMVTEMLSASSDDATNAGEFSEATEAGVEDFSDFFPEASDELPGSSDPNAAFQEPIGAQPADQLVQEAMNGFTPGFDSSERGAGTDEFPFPDDGAPSFFTESPHRESPADSQDPHLQRGLALVKQAGASEVMWFQPSATAHGFIAFFHNQRSGQILRFEAIGNTKTAAVASVIAQIRQHRQQQ